VDKRALTFSLFFAATGLYRMMDGIPFRDLWVYWIFVAALFLLTFRDMWAKVIGWLIYAFIKVLPTEWATKKRQKGYSNYGGRRGND